MKWTDTAVDAAKSATQQPSGLLYSQPGTAPTMTMPVAQPQDKVSSPRQTGLIGAGSKPTQPAAGNWQYTDYNGEQVRVDQDYRDMIAMNAESQNMAPQDYDRMLNPNTYGARWGIAAGAGSASGGTSAGGAAGASSTGNGVSDVGAGNARSATGLEMAQANAYKPTILGDPTQWKVTDEQTVAGQVRNIIAEDSPLQQQAEARSLMKTNASGLSNSSMAITAGQSALYDVALPIAQADAGTYSRAAGYNADEQNQFAVRNQDAKNTASQFEASSRNQASQFNASAENARLAASTQAAVNKAAALFDSNVRLQLEEIQNENAQLLQQSEGAMGLQRTLSEVLNSISTNADMTQSAKDVAAQEAIETYQNGLSLLSAVGKVPDLGDLVSFGTNLERSKARREAGFQPTLADVQSGLAEVIKYPEGATGIPGARPSYRWV